MKKRLLSTFLLIVCLLGLLSGCTININMGTQVETPAEETDSNPNFDAIFHSEEKPTIYESRAKIYITTYTNDSAAIFSSDITASAPLAEVYRILLQTDRVQGQIREEYPNVAFALSLEQINDTEVFAIIVTGENPQYLEEICKLAASLFCKTVQETVCASCKIVDYAKTAQKIGAN